MSALTPGDKVHVRLADGRVAEARYVHRGGVSWKSHFVKHRNLGMLRAQRCAPMLRDDCRFICTSNLSPERLREMMR